MFFYRKLDTYLKVNKFLRDGYVNLGKIFSDKEIAYLLDVIRGSNEMQSHKKQVETKYKSGKYPSFETIFVMNDVFSDNVFSLACRKPQIIDFVSKAFNDDAYLYHSKVPLKYPGMPGFKYHQDYYYWYKMGCVFPSMATCFIALEDTDSSNGCLKVIPRSHLCGRIDHLHYDGVSDSEADPIRVNYLKERFGEVELKLRPGEVTIHHSNLLHGSNSNHSSKSRLALLGCFNTKENSPLPNEFGHPYYQYQRRFHGELGPDTVSKQVDFNVYFN